MLLGLCVIAALLAAVALFGVVEQVISGAAPASKFCVMPPAEAPMVAIRVPA